jgi:hypothetical protein
MWPNVSCFVILICLMPGNICQERSIGTQWVNICISGSFTTTRKQWLWYFYIIISETIFWGNVWVLTLIQPCLLTLKQTQCNVHPNVLYSVFILPNLNTCITPDDFFLGLQHIWGRPNFIHRDWSQMVYIQSGTGKKNKWKEEMENIVWYASH